MDAEHRTGLIFFAEGFGAVLLLVATLFLPSPLPALGSAPLLRMLIGLAPIIPIWLILLACVRHYWRIDEYQRLVFLQIISLSAGILFCFHVSYPIAQRVFGLPPAPDILSWPFSVVVLLVSVWFSRHRRSARA